MGSCMVSPEGACAAYYLYGRWRDTAILGWKAMTATPAPTPASST